jgi:putative ABC transport system ATP-binding protein
VNVTTSPPREPATDRSADLVVDAIGLRKSYDGPAGPVEALRGVDLAIDRGEVVAIMGPSGSGKTTLLNCLAGLDSITSGTVTIVGQDLAGLSDRELTRLRAHSMGFVFQDYNLLPLLTALENVELPLLAAGLRPRQARGRAVESLMAVSMGERQAHRPGELSGGQRQRVAIARALAAEPAIVWADEPTGALDTVTSGEVIDLMLDLNREHQLTFVWVTHSREVAVRAHRIITMRDGRIADLVDATVR